MAGCEGTELGLDTQTHCAGGPEYLAHVEEIKREGWRAKRLFRIPPPPPLHQIYAAASLAGKMAQNFEGGCSKRRFKEGRFEGRNFADNINRNRGGGDDYESRREADL